MQKVQCCYLWDPEVVKHFLHDKQIRRTTVLSLFSKMKSTGALRCFKSEKGHEDCSSYNGWKKKHPLDAADIVDKANNSSRSLFIPLYRRIRVHGKNVDIEGGIKSIQPPCEGYALSYGDHPFTCTACAKQKRELIDTIRHRQIGAYKHCENRIGLPGFNTRYARRMEFTSALSKEKQKRQEAEKKFSQLVKTKLTSFEWESKLLSSCQNKDDFKFALDLNRLLSSGIAKSNPIQVLVLRNLVSKLLKKNNHHYVDLVKDISGLFRNELGPANYAILSEIFGLARVTTASNHAKTQTLDPGINHSALSSAAISFKGMPVNEASDGARALRYIQPYLNRDGKVVLLGKSWDPDVKRWNQECKYPIPRRDVSKGDPDDFTALKRFSDSLVSSEQLSKTVSVHNLVSLTSHEKPTIIYCMWPTPDSGYKAQHLLKYWEHLRFLAFYDENGKPRQLPINLMGFSTDAAGFSLSAAIHLMTPSYNEVSKGVVFLGLGESDERFLAPYFWSLPSIAYLDYDHAQRLFLKNLKYQTRELTFWKDGRKTVRLATVNHLKDLRRKCEELGMDCGFNAMDLVLIYFFDQNSDACERLFTLRAADLLDKFIPGSQATSLYIRAVYHLIEPFRKADFGYPGDVQCSVSCAITILRLWKKALELQKLRLHASPGAKHDPAKRGHFITYGCYSSAEVLFAAATAHQLAMFMHFKDLGPYFASPNLSGTKTTERIISEMQGKTNEIQTLDAQPSYVDMLHRSSSVQYNLDVKQKLAGAGISVKSSSKRRRLAFGFKNNKDTESKQSGYEYPASYSDFLKEQKASHRKGVSMGQKLFETYMPSACVELLKRSKSWEAPYTFKHPDNMVIANNPVSQDYNKLNESFYSDEGTINAEVEAALESENDEKECIPTIERKHCEDIDSSVAQEGEEESVEEPNIKEQDKKWKISKRDANGITMVHIRQAVKLVLPREYISRSRSKRHVAAKYLPGKAPLNPEHNIVKFCDVALKAVVKGKKYYDIARVEVIQSLDGSDVASFQLKPNASMRLRCSIYDPDDDDEEEEMYAIKTEVILTPWKSASSVLGPVELLPHASLKGIFILHSNSRKMLNDLGFCQRPTVRNPSQAHNDEEEDEETQPNSSVEDGFYEVDEITERRLNKDGLYEYKVRFKNYGPEDDMWLPASSFNGAIEFSSTSRFGRKRKHVADPSTYSQEPLLSNQRVGGDKIKKTKPKQKGQKNRATSNFEKEFFKPEGKRSADMKTRSSRKRKAVSSKTNKEDKGRLFRKNIDFKKIKPNHTNNITFVDENDISLFVEGSTLSSSCSITRQNYECSDIHSQEGEHNGPLVISDDERKVLDVSSSSEKTSQSPLVISDDDYEIFYESNTSEKKYHSYLVNVNGDCVALDKTNTSENDGFIHDLLRSDDNFRTPRRILAEAHIPPVDITLDVPFVTKEKEIFTDPLTLSSIPPKSRIQDALNSLRNKIERQKFAMCIDGFGSFSMKGLLTLMRYHRMKELKDEVQAELKWVGDTFNTYPKEDRDMVVKALLDRWNLDGTFVAKSLDYFITSQELSRLCGERYLSDEMIHFFIQVHCHKANMAISRDKFVLLPSFVTARDVQTNILSRVCRIYNIKETEVLFLPVHISECHWGLAVFYVEEQTVRYDDGLHLPLSEANIKSCRNTLNTLLKLSGRTEFDPKKWKFERFDNPMPDQPTKRNATVQRGHGSCGVGVVCCVIDLCNGKTNFQWSFNEAHHLRANLMIDIVKSSRLKF